MPGPQEILENAAAVARCALFHRLDDGGRMELARLGRRRRYTAGTSVFHTGDPGDSLLLILSGTLRVSQIAAGGDEIILADLRPGDALGEIAVLDGQGRTAEVTAMTDSELMVLERRDFIAFIHHRPAFSLAPLELLCARIRRAEERSTDFLFMSLPGRLAKALLERSAGLAAGEALSLTQSELAQIAGATRSNVNRQLKEWERAGLIQISRLGIVILDRSRIALAS